MFLKKYATINKTRAKHHAKADFPDYVIDRVTLDKKQPKLVKGVPHFGHFNVYGHKRKK